jgi:hypothetical protein
LALGAWRLALGAWSEFSLVSQGPQEPPTDLVFI